MCGRVPFKKLYKLLYYSSGALYAAFLGYLEGKSLMGKAEVVF